jgi:hypothetical protein
MDSWPYTAFWAAWLGKREEVKLTEMVMEAAKASRTAQSSSELLSCDENKHKLLSAQVFLRFKVREKFALCFFYFCM